nr:MAG TPA: endonuclease [Caudoviricetes sp.]
MKTQEYLDKYNEAKERYLAGGISLTKLAAQYGLDRGTFAKNLKQDRITIINEQNKSRMNQYFFDNIDTEEKAYWLGFLYADGAIGSSNNSIELSLKSSDSHHLDKFISSLNFKNKTIFKDDIRCRVTFQNKHLHDRLIQLGCTPRKSLTLTFPSSEQVPNTLIRHFIRGYIDGDGSVMIGLNHKKERVVPRLSILGTESFLKSLILTMGWKENNISHPSGAFAVEWGGKYVFKYLEDLYKDSTIYLDRKYQRFLYLQNIFADNKSQD